MLTLTLTLTTFAAACYILHVWTCCAIARDEEEALVALARSEAALRESRARRRAR